MTKATQNDTLINRYLILPTMKLSKMQPEQDWAPGQACGAGAAPEVTELKPPGPQTEQAPAIRIQQQSVGLNNNTIEGEKKQNKTHRRLGLHS